MRYLLPGLVLILLLCACGPEKKAAPLLTQENIQGKWNVELATRNLKKTIMLQSGFLHFHSDSLTSNINETGDTLTTVYDIVENDLISDKFTYNVLYKNKDSLQVSMKMRNFNFNLYLLKE